MEKKMKIVRCVCTQLLHEQARSVNHLAYSDQPEQQRDGACKVYVNEWRGRGYGVFN